MADDLADRIVDAFYAEQDAAIPLDDAYDGQALYNEIVDADHWAERGYELTNPKVVYADGEQDFGATTADDGRDVDHYHTQFSELEEDGLWVHVDVPGGTTGEIRYSVTMGDVETIADDLAAVIADVQDGLDA